MQARVERWDRSYREREAGAEVEEEGLEARVVWVADEHLGGGDDGLDVLEVDDEGAVAAEDGGRVGEERVQHAEVPRRQPRHLHDPVPPELPGPLLRARRRRHHQPLLARRRRHLPPRHLRRPVVVMPAFHVVGCLACPIDQGLRALSARGCRPG